MKLRPHQLDALDHMVNGCILNGGTGSGKSLTAVAYYYVRNGGQRSFLTGGRYEKMPGKPKDLYIITTARKRDTHDWDSELSSIGMSSKPESNMYDNRVVVDSWNLISRYTAIKNSFFIFDEQRVVGTGAWSRSFIKIAKHNSWIMLSATPGDKWEDYISVFIANGFYPNKTEFSNQHLIYRYGATYPEVIGYRNVERLVRLRNQILINMDFERSTVQHHHLIRTDWDREKYQFVLKERKNPDKGGYVPTRSSEKGALKIGVDIPINQVAPILDNFDYVPRNGDWVRYEYAPIESAGEYCYKLREIVNRDPSKFKKLGQLIDVHPRVIIFYKYDYERDDLLSYCAQQYPTIKLAEWNGHHHQELPTTEKWIYIVQYTAGCEGWNCVTTDTIIFFSQDYSYKVMIQASGRIDRLTTTYKDLNYYHFVSRSSIDSAIIKALQHKKKFNEGSFSNKFNDA